MQEPYLSFNHASVKIEWAKVLLGELNRIAAGYIEREPYIVTFERNPNKPAHEFKVGLKEPIPWEIICLIGDVCHNLRASMDFCWMGVHRSIDRKRNKETLPITSNEKGLVTTLRKIFKGEALAKTQDLLVGRIKSRQDFDNGGNRYLCALNDISNWQKHNLLVPTIGVTNIKNVVIKNDRGGSITIGSMSASGQVNVARMSGESGQLSYDNKPTFEIMIEAKYLDGRQPVIELLGYFVQTAAQTLQAFGEVWPMPSHTR